MRTALEDNKYSLIKAHILDPENSPLSPEHQEMLDRILSVARILDKNPIQKNAVSMHMARNPHISRSQAYEDLRLAIRMFNTLHSFDYDFWQTWLINDIVRNIEIARKMNTPQSLRVVAMEHANLIKALGERPSIPDDPRLTEKHSFYILVQNNNTEVKIDYNRLKDLPEATLRELNKIFFSGNPISEADAEEIMKT